MPEFQNPNLQTQGPGGGGGGGSFTSTITFITLMLLVFLGYQYFVHPNTPASQQSSPATAQQQQSAAAPLPPAQASAASPSAQPAVATPVIAAAQETTTTVENEQYRIVFSNRGALVRHWFLKNYYDSGGKQGGRNLDLVQPQAADKFGYPLSFFTYEPALTSQLNQALYQVSVTGAQPSPAGLVLAPTTISFHYAANGIDVVKTLHFDSTYVVGVDTRVTRNGVPVRALVQWPAGLGDMEEFRPSFSGVVFTSAASQFAWSLNGKTDNLKATKVSGDATFTAPYSYAAVADLYFAAAFMPDNPDQATVVSLHHSVQLAASSSTSGSQTKRAEVLGVAVGDTSGDTHLRLFAGPKETALLDSIHTMGPDGKPTGPSLQPLIHFGVFSIIAKPLYLAVRFVRSALGRGVYNWGWAIVIVGIILNLVTLPTRLMMTRSSLKMMRIQPKVDALKRKYAHLKATDPKRAEMNTEMMALYKTEGVNMYGGCLPMLIQMPLLYAIYEVLENAIELRQAHWFWLPDLSGPDPTYVLPALFFITMVLVQFISPSPGMDPAQRRMMAFVMPAVFGFTLFHFPSGLALYWFVGNLINLAIQVAINQSSIGKEMHAIAARRAAKKSGAKVIQARR